MGITKRGALLANDGRCPPRQHGATTVYKDNEGATKLANNLMASNTSKHIDIKQQQLKLKLKLKLFTTCTG
jgi:hypothetical protein